MKFIALYHNNSLTTEKNGLLLDLLCGATASPVLATQEGICVQGEESWKSEASNKRCTG